MDEAEILKNDYKKVADNLYKKQGNLFVQHKGKMMMASFLDEKLLRSIITDFESYKKLAEKEETSEKTEENMKKVPRSSKTGDIISKIKSIVGDDIVEIFGPTGSGKSRMVHEIAIKSLADGKKVFYYDTERNLSRENIEKLDKYIYSPVPEDLLKWSDEINRSREKYDLIIVDSVAFPALVKFARMNLKQRGEALLGLIAIFGSLKEYCYKNKSLVIATSQPISELSGKSEEERHPFGEKSCFAVKEIWLSSIKKGKDRSFVTISSWRSRDMGYGTVIAEVKISNEGVNISWNI